MSDQDLVSSLLLHQLITLKQNNKTKGVCVTIQQLDQRGNNARFSQHGGTGIIHGNSPDHYHHLQDEVVLC